MSDDTARVLAYIARSRAAHAFLTPAELLARHGDDNTFLDPFSTLIGTAVALGRGNLFHPNVTLQIQDGGKIEIGDGNRLTGPVTIEAIGGSIRIGDGTVLGDGGADDVKALSGRIEAAYVPMPREYSMFRAGMIVVALALRNEIYRFPN